MSGNIFGATAPLYYAVNIPVIPLHYQDKRPITQGWQLYNATMPSEEERNIWISRYANCNIGLALGPQSRVCVLDIDTTDGELQEIILSFLPRTPWRRVGAKGMVLGFKYTGIPNFKIKRDNGEMVVEMLGARNQVVLPPSIHPSTKLPYTASCELYDVVDRLPELNPQIESLLRGALKDHGIGLSHSGWTKITDWVATGARDVTMTKLAGFWANGVTRGEVTLLEAIDRMVVWAETRTEKVAGDDIDVNKGIQNLFKFLIHDVEDRGKILPKGWDAGMTDEQKREWHLSFDEDQQEWSFEEIQKYLQIEFETHGVDTIHRANAIKTALRRIVRAQNMDQYDKERLMMWVTKAGGPNVTIHAVRKQVTELQKGTFAGKSHAEIAKAVVEDFDTVAPFAHDMDEFWQWNGSHWEKVPRQVIMEKIANEYGHYDIARRGGDHYSIMRVMANIAKQGIQESSMSGVNFANGILLANGELIQHNSAFGMTYTLPFRYMPEEARHMDKFSKFLERCWGNDPDFEYKLMALQEAICITMMGWGPKYQRAMLLYGVPKSGKSQLLDIVIHLLPDEARTAIPPNSWSDKFLPAQLNNRLLNVCGELSSDRNINGEMFKQIVTGEPIIGQHKNRDPFTFVPKATHWFATNHLPNTNDPSAAFNRRWLIFVFNEAIKDEERINNYGELIVADEREGIAAWAMQALDRLDKQPDVTLPTSHGDLIQQMALANNSVRSFILGDPRVRVTGIAQDGGRTLPHISESRLFLEYWQHCLKDSGVSPVKRPKFRQMMHELGQELGFRTSINRSEVGTQEYVYTGLILVDKKAA